MTAADLIQLADRLEAALTDALGGADVRAWCERHYIHGHTLDQIAADAHVSPATVFRRCQRMRGSLAAHGLLPQSWRRQPPGPRERVISQKRNDS